MEPDRYFWSVCRFFFGRDPAQRSTPPSGSSPMVSPPPHQNRSSIATPVTLTPPSGRRYHYLQAVRGITHPSGVAAVCLKPLITPPPWRSKPHNPQYPRHGNTGTTWSPPKSPFSARRWNRSFVPFVEASSTSTLTVLHPRPRSYIDARDVLTPSTHVAEQAKIGVISIIE